MALYDLPEDPNLNVVSTVVTGGHGSGIHNPTFASYVAELTYIDGTGKAKSLKKDKDSLFDSFLHSFGTLSIIFEMKMVITEEYMIKKCIYTHVPWDSMLKESNFDSLNYDSDHLVFYTDWN